MHCMNNKPYIITPVPGEPGSPGSPSCPLGPGKPFSATDRPGSPLAPAWREMVGWFQ